MINYFDGTLILLNLFIFIVCQTIILVFVTKQKVFKEIDYIIKFYKDIFNNIFPKGIKTKKNENIFSKNEIKKLKKTKERPVHLISYFYVRIIVPLIVLFMIGLLLFIIGYYKNTVWTGAHTFGLFMIIFAYVTEILVFFLLIYEYRPVNASEILYKLINAFNFYNLKEKIDELLKVKTKKSNKSQNVIIKKELELIENEIEKNENRLKILEKKFKNKLK